VPATPTARGTRSRLLGGLVLAAALVAGLAAAADVPVAVEVFTRPGCPRCAEARRLLEELERESPELEVVVRDVEREPAARARLIELATRHGVDSLGLPAFRVGDGLIVGFDSAETTGARLRALLGRSPKAASPRDLGEDELETRLLGRLRTSELGLPLFTVAVGLLDGFNPCAMWVLLFVLALLVNMRERLRMLLVGGTFVAVSGLVYFALMAAWLNAFLVLGSSRPLALVLGGVASGIGLLNIKDSVAPERGPSLKVAESAKPGFYRRVRRIVQADDLGAALAGAAVLALLVNLIELACTAGLPVVYTRILTLQGLSSGEYYAYLALYNVAYMLDDLAMLTIAVVTLDRFKLQERGGRRLKLVSGVVMLGLGVALLLG
jgi:glutaredoxin